jgi:hypothetical protein
MMPWGDARAQRPGSRLWLVVTLAGVVVAVVAGHAGWAVIGWAVGGVAAVVLVAVNKRR